MASVGITQIMNSFVSLFGIIYTTGQALFTWFSTPFEELGFEWLSYLGDYAQSTPIEVMFGMGLFVILVYAFVKFIIPM